MPAIDRLLEAAIRHRVETVILEPGRKPRLRREGYEQEVTAQPLQASTIEYLVAEIAPGRRLPNPREEPRCAFDYTLGEATFHFVGLASPNGWLFTAAILPSPPAEPTPSLPAKPPMEQERRPLPSLDTLLRNMAELGASDLHLTAWEPPWLKIHGELSALETFGAPTSATLKERVVEILIPGLKERFEHANSLTFVHPIEGLGRFRFQLFRERRGIGASIRFLPERVPTVGELELPASLVNWASTSHGLLVLAGPPSSGKTTTLAALLCHLAAKENRNILALSRWIEYEIPSGRSLVRQLELPAGESFDPRTAIDRLDADVVAFDNWEDQATCPVAFELASSGRLVLLVLEAGSAGVAMSKLLDSLRAAGYAQVGDRLADVFAGLGVQKLARRPEGPGRFAVWELVPPLPSVTSCIRELQLWKLPAALAAAHEAGAIHEVEGLADLVSFQFLTPEEALRLAWDRNSLLERLEAGGLFQRKTDSHRLS